ncbi:MAG: hypothetical protein H5T74_11690 [Actinobacteria bacterium]|nr:hypothetical protein [Actinomycetota bacterium]MDI6830148.1 hypothetical protein [Actinomycetota bacterium]
MAATALSERGRRLLRDFPAPGALYGQDRKGIEWLIDLVERAAEYDRTAALPRVPEPDGRVEREPGCFDWEMMREAREYFFLSLATLEVVGGLANKHMVTGMAPVADELGSACGGGIGLAIAAHSPGMAPVIACGGG